MKKSGKISSCKKLLKEYYNRKTGEKFSGELLVFDVTRDLHKINTSENGVCDLELIAEDVTIYNPTKPIIRENKKFLIGRVEPRGSEESRIMFFEDRGGVWRVVDEAPVLGLQDPFYAEDVQGFHIIGGVQILREKSGHLGYRTAFYRFRESILELFDGNGDVVEPFAVGPWGMKDIRLIDLKNGKIAVFTRPQGGHAGLGKIGYIEINSLDELSSAIPKGRIIENQFEPDEWGGANELHLLENGKIGVLGHIAHFDGNVRHYYAMAFVYDPATHKHSHMEILTTADEFPEVASKKSELGKVIFSGGLHRHADGTADLYVGVGDMQAGKITIKDPFIKHEK